MPPDRPRERRRSLGDLRGPTRVVGGPRSGKTEQLIDLAVEWLTGGGDPTRLVMVIRSRDGAALLRRRVEAHLPSAHPLLRVDTHERLANSVLTAVGTVQGSLEPLSSVAEWLAMREALQRASPLSRLAPLVDEPSCINDALAVVSACKRALVGPGLLAARLRDGPDSLAELAVLSASYQQVLDEMGSIDRRDSHSLALEALYSDASAMRGWADLLLVDEAEDLSPAQWLLIRELGLRLSPPGRLVMAGHWSESTPGFRGVSSESSSRPFEEYFPSELFPQDWTLRPAPPSWIEEVARTLQLELPSPDELPDPAEVGRLDEAAFRVPTVSRVWVAADETEEAMAVAREIARARLQGELGFSDVAVLVHSLSRQMIPIKAALTSLGIPYRRPGGVEQSGQPLVVVALNWLRVLSSPNDAGALLTALAAGPKAVTPAAIRGLRQVAGRRNVTPQRVFWEWARTEQSELLTGAGSGAESMAAAELREAGHPWLPLAPWDPAAAERELSWPQLRAVLGQVELASGAAEVMLQDVEVAAALAEFATTARAVADVQSRLGRETLTLTRWLELLRLVVRHAGREVAPHGEGDRSEVALLTMRQAKGGSWSRVFICGCVAGIIPASADSGGLLDAEDVQELVRRVPELEDVVSAGDRQQDAEARLFLVALTRATGDVTCSWARRYQGKVVERSSFLAALTSAGVPEIAAPRAELVQRDDLVTELALATPSQSVSGLPIVLGRATAEMRQALAHWDPVAEGQAVITRSLSISPTSVGAWLACPRQFLAHLLGPGSEPDVNLTLGSQAHRLLELLYQQRASWEDRPDAFREVANGLVQQRLMPDVRADLADPIQVVYAQLWLERLVARWGRRIVAAGTAAVGEPIAEEVSFDLPREGWHLKGKVDALWRHPDGEIEVLDYKTGSTRLSESALRAEVFGKPPDGPRQWQLPIYQLAARAGAFAEELGGQVPSRVRNWYVGTDPRPKDPNPIAAAGFRIVGGREAVGGTGLLTDGELDRIEKELDKLAEAILAGRFPAQPRHSQRTCRDGRSGCQFAFWCDGEGSVGREFPTPSPEL
ncbi:MAG: PD-(D/E)XK nuclease family protein [Candidatus Dormiibacterota bacterium]